jgi:DnaK suppressor protein
VTTKKKPEKAAKSKAAAKPSAPAKAADRAASATNNKKKPAAAKPAPAKAAAPTAKRPAPSAVKVAHKPASPERPVRQAAPARPPARAAVEKAKPFPPKKLEEFREQLRRKQREYHDSYTSSKDDSRNRQSDGTEDYIDYAVSSYDREFLLSLTELERRELVLIEEALRRLDEGGFGRCLQCAQPIPPKRLEVQPWARYCVACQELEDQGLLEERRLDLDDEEEDVRAADEEEVETEDEELEVETDLDRADDADDDEENLSLS